MMMTEELSSLPSDDGAVVGLLRRGTEGAEHMDRYSVGREGGSIMGLGSVMTSPSVVVDRSSSILLLVD